MQSVVLPGRGGEGEPAGLGGRSGRKGRVETVMRPAGGAAKCRLRPGRQFSDMKALAGTA